MSSSTGTDTSRRVGLVVVLLSADRHRVRMIRRKRRRRGKRRRRRMEDEEDGLADTVFQYRHGNSL